MGGKRTDNGVTWHMFKLARNSILARAMLATAAVVVATPASAGPYLPMLDAPESIAFLDLGSMKAVERERWVWLVTVAKQTPSALPDRADVVALNIRFDCARGQMQVIGINRFLLDRKPIQLDTTPTDTAPVPPDTGYARMMDAACDGNFERGSVLETPPGFTMFDLSTVIKRALAKAR